MEIPESSRKNSILFLEDLLKTSSPPCADTSGEDTLPVKVTFPRLAVHELESECLEMARSYLSKHGCPGILSYHISAEVYRRLTSTSLDTFKAVSSTVNGDAESVGVVEDLYDGDLLARALLIDLHMVCKDWSTDFPPLKVPVDKVDLSVFAIKNSRRKMEDRFALCIDVNSQYRLEGFPHQAYYAVFDGHIGAEAAAYASLHLLTNIVRHAAFKDDPLAAIKGAIQLTDDYFCKKKMPRAGTTAVATLLRGDKLYVGWIGDSQAIIVRKGKPQQLVQPHKPDQEEEQKRIEEAGGMIIWNGAWRVNGNLSVSRAIGDAPDKKFVIGEGDVMTTDIDGTEDYLFVACDGVWDVMSGEEIVECVSKHLAGPNGSKQSVAKAVIQHARSEGSGDNMTVIVVFFSSFDLTAHTSVDTPASDSVSVTSSQPVDTPPASDSVSVTSSQPVDTPPASDSVSVTSSHQVDTPPASDSVSVTSSSKTEDPNVTTPTANSAGDP